MVHDRLPHDTTPRAKSALVADNYTLLLGPRDGHVDARAVKHEAGQLAASTTADRRDDDDVRIGSLAGVNLRSGSSWRARHDSLLPAVKLVDVSAT